MRRCYHLIDEGKTNEKLMGSLLRGLERQCHYGVMFIEWQRNRFSDDLIEFFWGKFEKYVTYSFQTRTSYMEHWARKGAFVFLMTSEMIEILVDLSEGNLFFRDEFNQITCPFCDLCLFRKDGTLLLGTVSHEKIADLYLTEDEKSQLNVEAEFKKEKLEYERAEIAKFTVPLYDEV